MADLPPYRTPRWVKMFGIIAIGLILLVVAVLLVATALGLHTPGGPGRHAPFSDAGGQTPLSSVIKDQALSDGELADRISRSTVTEHGAQQP